MSTYPTDVTALQVNAVSRNKQGIKVVSEKTGTTKFIGNLISVQSGLVRPKFADGVRETVACFIPQVVSQFILEGEMLVNFPLAEHTEAIIKTLNDARAAAADGTATEDDKALLDKRLVLVFKASSLKMAVSETTDEFGVYTTAEGVRSQTLNVNIDNNGGIQLDLRKREPSGTSNPLVARLLKKA